MNDELQRWKDIVAGKISNRVLKPGEIPGYTPPDPLATITVPNSRIGDGTGTSTYWSFQANLQRRVQQLADSSYFRSTASLDLVAELLGQSADDSIAYLGDADPDCAMRDALLADVYVPLYALAVTPVNYTTKR
jgi:hypothetical protein